MSYTINQDVLFKALGEVVDRIEKCGASPEITDASSFANELRSAIGDQYNPPRIHSLIRVIDVIKEK